MGAAGGGRRRAELVSAALRVARDKGVGATNVRSVAAEADVSTGTVMYHFSTFDDLVFTAVEGVVEEFYERRREIAERHADPRDRIVALVEAGVPDVISQDLRLVYESIPLLRQRPQYKPLHRSIVERQVMLYRTTIELGAGLGHFHPAAEPAAIARNLVALEDAYDLYPLIGVELDRAACRANVLSYASLALRCTLAGPGGVPRATGTGKAS
ncbi:TetR family transcriptional regulator [Xylanimonas allomyrinae]|uniref:TetR family transcriptional regulator n=1 Tax=Xylanimonas allomyrinae TaxID=2509459 RepID=A0A4P6ENZ7_9MICO|nr:TetR family transcriptional regulator [Xylanimonas allomyrinae]QAY63079.1 TetR family transcriptional regulator [Xylanimonas allomyrinae]